MQPTDWVSLAKDFGVPATMLGATLVYIARSLLPTLISSFEKTIAATREEHDRDRSLFREELAASRADQAEERRQYAASIERMATAFEERKLREVKA